MSPISSMVFLASLWRFERSDHSKRGPGTEASVLAPLTRVRSCQDLRRHLWILSPIQTGNRGPPNPTPDDFTQLFDDWSRPRSTPDHYRLSAICQPNGTSVVSAIFADPWGAMPHRNPFEEPVMR